ncbi:MAG TPA: SRPBCC domain-containing protein [Terriglobales bacterium]|nr:SRPBCC domain-containing protein [Terriglobales bacterium]
MSTAISAPKAEDLILSITEEIHVNASLEATFEALLEQLGPGMSDGKGEDMHMKIEAWPGGRWYRDLGNGNGHHWAHVQAIKRPTLLEFFGPLMLSHPVANNVQYRLSAEAGGTKIAFHHYAVGAVPEEVTSGMRGGWHKIGEGIKDRAERKRQ